MKFEISNLGYIKKAEIELGDLTIICGKNNTGKTYVNYAIYGFLKSCKHQLDFDTKNDVNKLLQQGAITIDVSEYQNKFIDSIAKFSIFYSESLAQVFNVNEKLLQEANFVAKIDDFCLNFFKNNILEKFSVYPGNLEHKLSLKISNTKINNILEILLLVNDSELYNSEVHNLDQDQKELIKLNIKTLINRTLTKIIAKQYFPDSFIITSERTGVSLFYKDLDISKNNLLDSIMAEKGKNALIYIDNILNDIIPRYSRYSQPVQDEINFVRDLDTISKRTGELAKNNPDIIDLSIDIIGGYYSVTDYSMSFKFTEDNKPQEIPLYSASSTVKSLMNLYFYLKHLAKPGDILIIDEPELNLHPENQRKLAKLFTRLTKCGLKLLMTTHSDYLIKELNNLIVLNNDFENKSELMDQYKYSNEDILEPDKVKVYIAENNTLNPAEITPLGIEVPTFDDQIKKMTNFYDEVTDNLDTAYDY